MKKNIFLTGGTGFLGGYLIAELLKTTPHTIYCLVREARRTSGADRLWQRIEKEVELEKIDRSRIIPIEGDITEHKLGLEKEFTKRIDEFWHCAAVLYFEHHKKEETLRVNWGGMKNALQFVVDHKIQHINFVSTAYVSGKETGLIKEEIYEHTSEIHNPYELSKRMCEKELLDWHKKYGFTFRILRPSIIIGDSTNYGVDSNSGLYGYLAILLRLKDKLELKMPEYFKYNSLKMLITEGASANLICVDHVVKLLMAVCEKEDTKNDVFHLTNPHPTPLIRYMSTIGDAFGIKSYAVYDKNELGPIDRLLLHEEDIFDSYLQTVHYFQCDKAFAIAKMDKDLPKLGYDVEYKVTVNAKIKFDEDKKVQRKRLQSVVHRLTAKKLKKKGREDLVYYVGGNGPTLVILNAYGQSLSFWDWVVNDLFKKYNVVIWSMRGTASQKGGVEQIFPIQTHVEDIKYILDNEHIEKCHIMAWCTGPKIALQFQADYPELVHKMIFLSSCFKGISGFEEYHTAYENDMQQICDRVDQNPHIASIIIEALKNILIKEEEVIAFKELQDDDQKRDLVQDILSLIGEDIKPMIIEPFLTPSSVLNYARQLLLLWEKDVTDLLTQLNIPVLMVTGKEDNISSCEISRAAARLSKNVDCAIIEGGTHYLHFDNTKLLLEIVNSYLCAPMNFEFKHGLVKLENEVVSKIENVINE
ncbi:alpha/beta fold hydrolase [Aquimarina sediminis]|uniref:alpha/beta fold hydrolase n=1 Tax=Aquimarina sediminis TaxID=2070536 RepID=UPI000CA05A47|nr:alpha/beta fold hydrolase [Aquimarina sediminis]